MRRYLLILFGLLLSLSIFFLITLPDKNLHVIFCDVGQGDAILITYGITQMLVDGGPDRSVLSCLGRHVAFWDRRIEIVMTTHPQEDHFGGLVNLVRNYKVVDFLHPDVEGTAAGWTVLKDEIKKHNIRVKTVSQGSKIRSNNLYFDIFNPINSLSSNPSSDLNDYSVVGGISFGNFDVLLTGDIGQNMIPYFLDKIKPIEVLKVPHHGSKNGLTQELLDKSNPALAVISVGKNNSYGHPHQEVIKLLRDKDIKILRTDQDGDVEVVSDGRRWWVMD